MKHIKDVGAWIGKKGSLAVPVPNGQLKAIVITDGASIRATWGEDFVVLATGRGRLEIDCYLPDFAQIEVMADDDDCCTSVHVNGWGPRERPEGWTMSESITQLELKNPSDVPVAIRDMMEKMQQNALRREAQLRAQIAALSKK